MTSIWECKKMSEQTLVSEDKERHATEVIMILLENGANINIQMPEVGGFSGETALHFACYFTTSNIVRLLLCHGANPNIQGAHGVTPLFISIRYSKYDTMKVLLDFGADVNFKTNLGNAPIHEILYMSSYDNDQNVIRGIQLLLEYGADVNIQNVDGATPLYLAVCRGWECSDTTLPIIVKLLLDANANVSIPLTKRCSYGLYSGISGDTTLHLAVRSIDSVKVVQLLLESHPNLSIYNSHYKETVLAIAKFKASRPMIDLIEEEIRNQMYKYLLHRWAPIKIPITSPNKIEISTSTPLVLKQKRLNHR